MSGLESEVVKVGQCCMIAVIDRLKNYVNYIKNCELNLISLVDELEKLGAQKDDIDDKVLDGKEHSEKVTAKARYWLDLVKDLVNDESMRMLMIKDMRIAKVMLRLMKNDLNKLVEDGGEMRDVVVKVMKDIGKRKRKAGGNREVSDVDEKEKQVRQVLEKLVEETIGEFKELMQNDDEKMAIAAMHLLETHKEKAKLKELTEKDKEMADIIAKARKISDETELLSDNNVDDENVLKNDGLSNEKTLKEKVKNILKPVGGLILSEELLKTLPENVRLGMEVMGVVIENRRGLKAELMDSDGDDATSRKNSCCCVISCNYFSDRYDLSVGAEAMIDKIKNITENKPGSQDVTRPTRRGEMEAIQIDSASLKSRNELFEKIIQALASNDVHALGVFGMGGSGKTTLATEVANTKAQGIFETVVMVEISESPNIESIQNQIGDGLGLKLHDVQGIREKAIRLHDRLTPKDESEGRKDEKKILIVLDNIWNKIDLDQIGIPRKYCKLLLTSRTKDVYKEMDVQEGNILAVGLLSKDEAMDLFEFQVQKVVTMEYKSVVDRLLKKCRGLPLSIVATANSLKGKELPFWRQFAEELEKPVSCQITGVHRETFSILRTSYEFMASEEKKKFFLLACLSPVGSSISIDNLIRYGIGLDLFQHVNKLSEAIELARTWAEELVSSSMFLKGDSDKYVKIHDVVRESTMSFASKSGLNTDGQMFLVDAIPRWICKETFNKYTGISLLSQANYARLSGVKADLLQILLLKGKDKDVSFLDSNFFQEMTNLKVLEVSFMNFGKGLPESIRKLKDLKTLHLVKCKLGDIKLIGKLESLLVLNLRRSYLLEGLPDEIGNLSNLRLLDMSGCWKCEQPRRSANVITRLSLLEGLYLVGSNLKEWAMTENTSEETSVVDGASSMDVFNKLEFLNVLKISMLGPTSFPFFPPFVKNFDKFQIHVGQDGFDNAQPSEHSLTFLDFDVSQELEKDSVLNVLLKKVDFLSLHNAKIKNIVPELDDEGFRNLDYLHLKALTISTICVGKVPTELFFNLRHLSVSDLEELVELLPVKPLPQKLTMLKISSCEQLTYIFSENGSSPPSNEDARVNEESDIIELPHLKVLEISKTSLISVVKSTNTHDSGHTSLFNNKVKLPSLEELNLYEAGIFVKVWGKEFCQHRIQNLKILKIISCNEIETIGPPSMLISLAQLESLIVGSCKKMQQVISKECERDEIPEEILTFPKLKNLQLYDLENLESFYSGTYKMKFPCLETLELTSLWSVAMFGGYGSSRAFFHEKMEFPSLEKLDLWYLSDKVSVLWDFPDIMSEREDEGITSNPLPKLRSLSVGNNQALQCFFSGEPNQVAELPSLEKVKIDECSAMKSLSTIPLKAPKLTELEVSECPKME